jgi:hypothetical protein
MTDQTYSAATPKGVMKAIAARRLRTQPLFNCMTSNAGAQARFRAQRENVAWSALLGHTLTGAAC